MKTTIHHSSADLFTDLHLPKRCRNVKMDVCDHQYILQLTGRGGARGLAEEGMTALEPDWPIIWCHHQIIDKWAGS